MTSSERKIDTSSVYMVAMPEERIPELEAILRSFKSKTTQESIFLELERNIEIRWL